MDRKYNYFDVGPNVVNQKGRYRENEGQVTGGKLTYNFITDPRLKRGHNFGVVYVTNSNYEDENQTKEMLRQQQNKLRQSMNQKEERNKKELMDLINKRKEKSAGFGICTDKVQTTVRPKPITFDIEVQTDESIQPPKEEIKLVWPEKTGIDEATQIEDGELFKFDDEVQPLVKIIVSKVLEESRREVLEEEEISDMNSQQNKYKKFNEEDEERIKKLEDNENKIYQNKLEKKNKKLIQIKLTKEFQQKLICRNKSKNYLEKIFHNSVNSLQQRGVFKKPEVNEYFNSLLPELFDLADNNQKNDYKISKGLISLFNKKNINNSINVHREAIKKQKDTLEQIRQEKIRKKEEAEQERLRKIEERKRRKHEKLLNEIRERIKKDLLENKFEFAEDYYSVENIYNINGYYQKNKNATITGGPIGQFSLVFCLLNQLIPKILNDEKIASVIDLYISSKSHPFTFVYIQDDIEKYKKYNEEIAAIEDISKCEEKPYEKLCKRFYENTLKNDDMLPFIMEIAKDLELKKFEKYYKLIFKHILKKYRDGTDDEVVKFVARDPAFDEINLEAICVMNGEVIKLTNTLESGDGKKNPVKKAQPPSNKPTFEHFFSEKVLLIPTISDNLKIISVNKNFDRVFRENLINCVDKLYKIDDIEDIMTKIDENYEVFINRLLIKLRETFKKEVVEVVVSAPKEGEEDEENDAEEGGGEEK